MPLVQIHLMPVPLTITESLSKKELYNHLVGLALHREIAPQAVDLAGVAKERYFVPGHLHDKVARLAESAATPFASLFAGLAAAGIEILMAQQAELGERVAVATQPAFRNASAGQTQFYQNLSATLDTDARICMAEASTGIGKSRALIAASIRQAEREVTPIVIAAPTLKVLGQLWGEFEYLRDVEGIGKEVVAGFFPGATEFVDRTRLDQILAEADTADQAVMDWAMQGGPVLHPSPLTRAMQASGLTLRFLMEDLRQIASEIVPQEAALRDTDAHPQIVPVRQFAASAQIIFCTHAMLARAHQSGWVSFPRPHTLLVDEGHQLEQTFASVHSDQMALSTLRRRLRKAWHDNKGVKAKAAKTAYQAVRGLFAMLVRIGKEIGGEAVSPTIPLGKSLLEDPVFGTALLSELQAVEVALRGKHLDDLEGIKGARSIIQGAISGLRGNKISAYLTFSPDHRFPSLLVGRGSVRAILGDLWRTTKTGAIISATLFVNDEYGNRKCDYTMDLLALPRSRMDMPAPVVAPWVTSVPTLHLPAPARSKPLARPLSSQRNQETEDAWFEALAQEIRIIAAQARGGMLVLTTAYAQVNGIGSRLGMMDRVILQNPEEKFAKAEARFRSMRQAGERPILLGVGSAWTGVDLADKQVAPAEDTLLTDLVIACLPVSLNRTTTMLTRIEHGGFAPILAEALMTLRQGLGRCVRHEEMTGRHIWLLDGRINTNWPGMQKLTRSVDALLRTYPKREQF